MSGSNQRTVNLLASAALLGMAAAWGSTFFLIHDLLDRVPVVDFLGVRFAIAAAAMILVAPRAMFRLTSDQRKQAVVLGGLYGGAQILQTTGLAHTPASVSGFITGMYVVATPFFAAAILRTKIPPITWLAVVLAITGIGVLSLRGVSIGSGELLTFVASMVYALHIIGVGAWTAAEAAIGMAEIQLLVVAAISLAFAAPGGIVLPHRGSDWVALLYMAIVAGALAMLGQTWAQAHVDSTRAAIIMSMEPVFAALFAVLAGQEEVTWRMLVGGPLVLAAMVLVEVLPRRRAIYEQLPS